MAQLADWLTGWLADWLALKANIGDQNEDACSLSTTTTTHTHFLPHTEPHSTPTPGTGEPRCGPLCRHKHHFLHCHALHYLQIHPGSAVATVGEESTVDSHLDGVGAELPVQLSLNFCSDGRERYSSVDQRAIPLKRLKNVLEITD